MIIIFVIFCLHIIFVFNKYNSKRYNKSLKNILNIYSEYMYFTFVNKLFSNDIKTKITVLDYNIDEKESIYLYFEKNFKYIIYVIFIVSFIAFLNNFLYVNEIKDYIIKRPEVDNEKIISTKIILKNKEKKEIIKKDVDIVVSKKQYSDEEAKLILNNVNSKILKIILNENSDVNNIKFNLNFPSNIEDVNIEYFVDNNYIRDDGSLIEENIIDDTKTTVYINLNLKELEKELKFDFILKKKENEILVENELLHKIKEDEINTNNDIYFRLPDKFLDYNILYKENKESVNYIYLLIILLFLIFIIILKELEDKFEYRNIEIMLDYPEIINKLLLYIRAGFTIKNSFLQIINDYNKSKKNDRYAYEELIKYMRKIINGESENKIYLQYANKMGNIEYTKLMNFLIRNLSKGGSDFIEQLEFLEREAFFNRKELIKRKIELASSKLIFVLMIYLIIVLIITIVPVILNN